MATILSSIASSRIDILCLGLAPLFAFLNSFGFCIGNSFESFNGISIVVVIFIDITIPAFGGD